MNMKRVILALLLLLTLSVSGAAKQEYSQIRGNFVKEGADKIFLYHMADGKLQEYASTGLGKDGSFGFLLIPEKEGFYYLGTERENFRIYLKKGEMLDVNIAGNAFSFTGKKGRENECVENWYKLTENLDLKARKFMLVASNYEDFFPEFEKTLPKAQEFIAGINTGNAAFDRLMKYSAGMDLEDMALTFIYTPRSKHPSGDMYPAFYTTIISGNKFDNPDLLENPWGLGYVGRYFMYKMLHVDKEKMSEERREKDIQLISDPVVRGEYVLSIARFKTYEQYEGFAARNGQYLATDSQKKRFHEIGRPMKSMAAGAAAVNFTYPDVNGKNVSLSDFKGKVVVVDVWATWCGPCKAEIPYFKKLEEEMEGKEVVFLGVSVDKEKDKNKWIDFVKQEKLGGVQVCSGGWQGITEDYKITGIPRFMVFDKQGNIVSIDAPRPSSPELKQLILKYL